MIQQIHAISVPKAVFISYHFIYYYNETSEINIPYFFEIGVWSQQFSETTSNKDAVEGETIRLDCRFNPQLLGNNPNKLIFYWHRTNNKKTDPVAINENPLDTDYSIEHNTIEGKYDLLIQRAQYDRDNGQFECKIKEAGNGAEIKSLSYVVTILSKCFTP